MFFVSFVVHISEFGLNQALEKTARRFGAAPVVSLIGAKDEVTFGAGDGDVEESFFLFEFQVLLGVVTGEFVLGHAGDEHGVKLQAFGLVDGKDGDAKVIVGEEVEVTGQRDPVGEFRYARALDMACERLCVRVRMPILPRSAPG